MGVPGPIRRYLSWKERDQIIKDMLQGRYTSTQTVWRLEHHSKPGGSRRDHVHSCRASWAPCRCPFAFDRTTLVPLGPGKTYTGEWVDTANWEAYPNE